jgi:hypothetical protein
MTDDKKFRRQISLDMAKLCDSYVHDAAGDWTNFDFVEAVMVVVSQIPLTRDEHVALLDLLGEMYSQVWESMSEVARENRKVARIRRELREGEEAKKMLRLYELKDRLDDGETWSPEDELEQGS